MRKYLNALRYGSKKTKRYLWSMLLLFFLMVAGITGGFMISSVVFIVFGVFAGVLGFVIGQSVSFKDVVQVVHKEHKIKAEPLEKEKKMVDQSDENYLDKYDEKHVKKLWVQFKVKKNTKTVMIDRSHTFRIRQCPAYMWREKRKVHFLLLEKEPRKISIEMDKVNCITYEKNVTAAPGSDYEKIGRAPLVRLVFSPFLPSYHEGVRQGKTRMFKNLYGIYPDIQFTNTSAANLFEVLDVDFRAEDEYTLSDQFDSYFKKAHRVNLLWKDGVIDVREYKNRIQAILKSMVEESKNQEVLTIQLRRMVKYRLITKEYADYYGEKRKKGPIKKFS